METWQQWFTRVTAGDSQRKIAERCGVSRATVHRWQKRETIGGAVVIKVSLAYDTDPTPGLIAARWMSPDEISVEVMRVVLKRVPSEMLIEELYLRSFPPDVDL
ncbi:helix-turn-helix domain-containing protein [Subtercola vilae]|uniref:Helix-turn-helix domain-containing protein n=1 Tax=Subtercola vilae TaxID=2056433 RepID=A0A4T2BWR5_9MICO|nr:helix-turn-helix domain-containing protein [Subtercola vilae]TIH34991.1 hypothetical protein D4765_11905 [Subtercola vilae]